MQLKKHLLTSAAKCKLEYKLRPATCNCSVKNAALYVSLALLEGKCLAASKVGHFSEFVVIVLCNKRIYHD